MDADRTYEEVAPGAVDRRLLIITVLLTMAAVGSVAALASSAHWDLDPWWRFALLAGFVLAGEVLPIPVPRRGGRDVVTASAAFAFAMLLNFGLLPACAVYALATVVADISVRTAVVKIAFNAAQYILSLAAAGAVLALAGLDAPVALHASELPTILLALVAAFVVNHVLAGTAAAMLSGMRVGPYLLDDIAFQALTAGCLLALAPWVAASADASVALIPVAFVPVLAIYFAARQAEINAHRAFHDRLTDLPNRWMLGERLSAALEDAERAQSRLAVMIVDLDDFKSINDTLGHHFGDRVLQMIAPRLVEAIGLRGFLARLGGDEFAVVVPDICDESDAQRCAERLLDALQRPCEVDSLALHIGGSIGIACYPQHGHAVADLLRHADVALYCAKSQRSTCAVYAEEHDEYSIDRLALASQLRRGIERGELIMHYQPKIPLNHQGRAGVEALVRWNHPQLGCIGPEAFVPLSEQTGLIKALTERVLEGSLSQCEAWRADGLDVRLSVNVSTRSLLDHDLPRTIRALLERYAVPADALQLEITESRIVTDLGRARTVLDELRAMGLTIAIDDFGTGFSSLSQLQQLPVDEIKIDRSFVMRMESDHDDAVLVRSIIELSHNLGLRVTAEGVESAGARQTLQELGCDFAQGYHISRPVPANECRRLLEAAPSGEHLRLVAAGADWS